MAKQSMTTILQARDCLPTRMNNGIELTIEALDHVLDYCYDNPNIIKLYSTSDMIPFIDSGTAHLAFGRTKSKK